MSKLWERGWDVDYVWKKGIFLLGIVCCMHSSSMNLTDVNLIRIVAAMWGLVLRLCTFRPLHFMKFTDLLHASCIKWYFMLVLDQKDYRTFCTIIVAMSCKTHSACTVHWIIHRQIRWLLDAVHLCSFEQIKHLVYIWNSSINFFFAKNQMANEEQCMRHIFSWLWNSQCKL